MPRVNPSPADHSTDRRYNRPRMTLTRREWIQRLSALAVASSSSAAFARPGGLKIGVTDWNLNMTGRVGALAFAKRIGFSGVQISLGRTPVDGHLPLTDRRTQLNYQSESVKLNFPITSTCLDILHVNYLKNDKLGQQWVREGIAATSGMGVEVMLLPFFGPGAIETRSEQDTVADILGEIWSRSRESRKSSSALKTRSARRTTYASSSGPSRRPSASFMTPATHSTKGSRCTARFERSLPSGSARSI